MPKRSRNNTGQFTSSYKEYKSPYGYFYRDNTKKKSITIFTVISFIIIASPWIAFLLKSKNLKAILFGLKKFFNDHFINNDEVLGVKWAKTPNDL